MESNTDKVKLARIFLKRLQTPQKHRVYTKQERVSRFKYFFPLLWTILYDRYTPIQTLIITLLPNVMLTVPKGDWATCGETFLGSRQFVLVLHVKSWLLSPLLVIARSVNLCSKAPVDKHFVKSTLPSGPTHRYKCVKSRLWQRWTPSMSRGSGSGISIDQCIMHMEDNSKVLNFPTV